MFSLQLVSLRNLVGSLVVFILFIPSCLTLLAECYLAKTSGRMSCMEDWLYQSKQSGPCSIGSLNSYQRDIFELIVCLIVTGWGSVIGPAMGTLHRHLKSSVREISKVIIQHKQEGKFIRKQFLGLHVGQLHNCVQNNNLNLTVCLDMVVRICTQ